MSVLFAPPVVEIARPAAVVAQAADFVRLTKPRLNLLVIGTTAAGFYLAADRNTPFWLAVNTVVGTWLVASGAAAFNQVSERTTDALMQRTRHRPVPDGRVSPLSAARFALFLAAAGLVELAAGANWLAAAVAAVSLVTYTLVYTPLKRRTSLSTIVGGIPGGLPPVIGWAAARGGLSVEAAALFGVVFFWQMPHFLAIAWMCREDYRRAGIPMLPVADATGHATAMQIVAYCAVLVPVSLWPAVLGIAGPAYFWGALVLSLAFLAMGAAFARARRQRAARRLFLASVLYLPLIWALMIGSHPR